MSQSQSPLQQLRLQYIPATPTLLCNLNSIDFVVADRTAKSDPQKNDPQLQELFPHIAQQPSLRAISATPQTVSPQRIGCVLSGGQASGGHSVIAGIFDALQELHPESQLFGFLDGPAGIIKNQYIEITQERLALYRNQGGFDLIGSGRTKIETTEQFAAALQATQDLHLDGLVIIGGDDSNTNAAYLAEFFLQQGSKTAVIGVPKTVDGDLQNKQIEISFGFDTATKIYSETIGNIARDALSAKKYYYFVKLMGRSASHITLECALQTKPNLALIGEELLAQNKSLADVVEIIVSLILERDVLKKNYGIILLPEGIIEFLTDMRQLIRELNALFASGTAHSTALIAIDSTDHKIVFVDSLLQPESQICWKGLPTAIQLQLLMDRDPHGNIQVSKIESERLLIYLVENALKKKRSTGQYQGSFSAQPIFCGYEGRSALPSNFDANYGYSLGKLAALLIARRKTGYMTAITHLQKPAIEWQAGSVNLVEMMHFEERAGKQKAVIAKALVDVSSTIFAHFIRQREKWRIEDCYVQPGPIQFFGPTEVTDTIPRILSNKA